MILTFQDFEKATDVAQFVMSAIQSHKQTDEYKLALIADEYDAQRNTTIYQVAQMIYNAQGVQVEDFTASNARIASNFFNRLNTQRCLYSLGNGVSFIDPYEAAEGDTKDETKEALGKEFDHVIVEATYHALIHGRSYLYWADNRVYEFEMTEFVPLVDETDGSLRAGIRFWQLDETKPLMAVLYEQDGYTKYKSSDKGGVEELEPKRAYKVTYEYTEAGDLTIVGEENYGTIPIVTLYASRLRQSTLVGMRETIDAYDLIMSGFANDLSDCAQIYWIVENYGGMEQDELAQFLDRLKLNHIANIDTSSGGGVRPYTQEIPTAARTTFLSEIRAKLYEDFGGLDVHVISAGSTNDHIDAAYQPMDEQAADLEHWVGTAIEQLLELQGIEDTPVFRRNRISNYKEQVEIVLSEAQYLDSATILRKLPNLTPEEAQATLEAKRKEDEERMQIAMAMQGAGMAPQVEEVAEDEG